MWKSPCGSESLEDLTAAKAMVDNSVRGGLMLEVCHTFYSKTS